MRRSRKEQDMNSHEKLTSFPFERVHDRLRSADFSPSIKAADIPDEAAEMLMNNESENVNVGGGDLPKGDINTLQKTPPINEQKKPKLKLRWAEPENMIIDLPGIGKKKKPKRRK